MVENFQSKCYWFLSDFDALTNKSLQPFARHKGILANSDKVIFLLDLICLITLSYTKQQQIFFTRLKNIMSKTKSIVILFLFSIITSFVHSDDNQNTLADVLIKYGKHSQYYSPLNYALEEKDYQSALILIKFIGDVDTRDATLLPLDRLCRKSNEKLSREQEELFRIFFTLNAKNSSGISSKALIFHKAANFGSLDLINWLLSQGIDLSENNGYPFQGALSSGDVELVRYLLSLELDISKIKGILHTAIASRNLELVMYVWEELGQRPTNNWGNPLIIAMGNHDLDIFIYLLNAGLSPNNPRNFVLQHALSLSEVTETDREYKNTVVKLLLDHGAEYGT